MAEQPEKIRGKHVRRKYVSPLMIAEPKTKTVKVTDADPSREGYTPIPEVAPPVERKEYKGFKVPPGLSLPQLRKWKQAINAREAGAGERQEARDDADTEALKQGIIDRTKGVGGVIKGAGEAIVEPFAKGRQWINRAARDPDVALEAGEFARRVSSGDRESLKQLAKGASDSMVEPWATIGDAGMAKFSAEEVATVPAAQRTAKKAEAAMYAGSVFLPGALGLFMSRGWLKTAIKAGDEIPDAAAKKLTDLKKRVDEGKVTDDMQIRRELAGIEDAHKAEHMQSKPPGGGSSTRSLMDFEDDPKVAEAMDYIIDMENSDAMWWLEDQYKAGKVSREEVLKELDVIAEQAWFDDAIDTVAYPNATRPETMFDRSGRPMPELPPFKPATEAQLARTREATQDTLRKHSGKKGGPGGGEGYPDPYDSDIVDTLTPEQLREKALHDERSRMLEERGYDDDFDAAGPSEAEIQEMIQTSKFGDPNELEMLKEDMRRLAQAQQEGDIARSTIRGKRTPVVHGAPPSAPYGPGYRYSTAPEIRGAKPEGTSRAVRRGPRRERPKKKDE